GVESRPKLSVMSYTRNMEIPYPCPAIMGAGETVKHTVGGAGVRGRKKQRPLCNGVDRDLCPDPKGC
ncbi:MAG: hypothetical protein ACE5HI_10970, partial [bacterium]